MKFTKMHGCGNDYVYVNCLEEKINNPNKVAKFISDRHFGIGSDGMICICPSDKADFRMAMYNSDGSEGALAVSVSGTFRYRLIGSWGVRRYYQKRKGETLLSPAEQQQVVALARKLGVRLDEYFDGYVEEYDW